MTDPKELLAVLDLPEDERFDWCLQNIKGFNRVFFGGVHHGETHYKAVLCPSLADLAFRLRDEAIEAGQKSRHAYWGAVREVAKLRRADDCDADVEHFWTSYARPIHWIIAALIAKEKK